MCILQERIRVRNKCQKVPLNKTTDIIKNTKADIAIHTPVDTTIQIDIVLINRNQITVQIHPEKGTLIEQHLAWMREHRI